MTLVRAKWLEHFLITPVMSVDETVVVWAVRISSLASMLSDRGATSPASAVLAIGG